MRTTIGIIAWSLILTVAYRKAPQFMPQTARLFRIGVRCLSLVLPAVSLIPLVPVLSSDVAAIAVGVLVGCGTFFGLICIGLAWMWA